MGLKLRGEVSDATAQLFGANPMTDKPTTPAQGKPQRKGWTVDDWSGGRIAIQNQDFTHDEALELTGDWATPEEKRACAERIAAILNASESRVSAPLVLTDATTKILLDLLNPLHGRLDKQTYDNKRQDNFDTHPDTEHSVEITSKMEGDLTKAVLILEGKLTAALPHLSRGESELVEAFGMTDDQDWEYLLSLIPDGGRGRFWKAVIAETRQALSRLDGGKK